MSVLPAPRAGEGSRLEHTARRDELELVARLRAGDHEAFTGLVEALHPLLVRLAMTHVRSWAVAEEAAQEAWIGVFERGIGRFEGRSSLRAWIVRIALNTAKTLSVREGRTIPASSLLADVSDGDRTPADPCHAGAESRPQGSLASVREALPEDRLLSRETVGVIEAAVESLPQAQRRVITLRDLVGVRSQEVCELLGVSPGNQRVLLHRARTRVRDAVLSHEAGAPTRLTPVEPPASAVP